MMRRRVQQPELQQERSAWEAEVCGSSFGFWQLNTMSCALAFTSLVRPLLLGDAALRLSSKLIETLNPGYEELLNLFS